MHSYRTYRPADETRDLRRYEIARDILLEMVRDGDQAALDEQVFRAVHLADMLLDELEKMPTQRAAAV